MSYNIIIYVRHDKCPVNIKQTKSRVKDKDQDVVVEIDDKNAARLANPIVGYTVKISRKISTNTTNNNTTASNTIDKKGGRDICLDVEFKLRNGDYLALAKIDPKKGPTEAQIITIQNVLKNFTVKSNKYTVSEFWNKKNHVAIARNLLVFFLKSKHTALPGWTDWWHAIPPFTYKLYDCSANFLKLNSLHISTEMIRMVKTMMANLLRSNLFILMFIIEH